MSKYIDAEKLVAKIQPHYENAKCKARYAAETGTSSDCTKWYKAKEIYEHILRIISSLQQEMELPEKYQTPDWLFEKHEQPEVDFDEEFNKFHIGMYNPFDSRAEIYEFARHFFELGLNARKED